mgnify:FL=1
MDNIEYKYLTNPYVRDVFLAYLIEQAHRTVPDGYPILEDWMIATEVPKEVFQWDCRDEVNDPTITGMSFYCNDKGFTPVLNNPHRYVEKLSQYACVIGMDASPYDNMPLAVQKSQIFTNLAITYFYGRQGLKIIPNVRLGNDDTVGMLDAIPKECRIAVGTNGFIWRRNNRTVFKDQMNIVIDVLRPTGVIVYGQAYDYVFQAAIDADIPIYKYDSHTIKRNAELKSKRSLEGDRHER